MASRYATALFELVRDEGELESTEATLVRLEALINECSDLRKFVRSPVLSTAVQSRVIVAIAEKIGAGTLATNFLKLVTENRRLFALRDIIIGFRQLVAKSRGQVTAYITSAIPLSEAHTQNLGATLKAKTGKDITLNSIVDPAILGGLIVKIGSTMIDSSIRTKLNNLKIVMKEVG